MPCKGMTMLYVTKKAKAKCLCLKIKTLIKMNDSLVENRNPTDLFVGRGCLLESELEVNKFHSFHRGEIIVK